MNRNIKLKARIGFQFPQLTPLQRWSYVVIRDRIELHDENNGGEHIALPGGTFELFTALMEELGIDQ